VYETPSPLVDGVCDEDPAEPRATTFRLRLDDLKRSVLHSTPTADALRAESLSPDGRFIWLANYESPRTTVILDLTSRDVIRYMDEDEWASRWFLAWVASP
jgi:hypothetical protein